MCVSLATWEAVGDGNAATRRDDYGSHAYAGWGVRVRSKLHLMALGARTIIRIRPRIMQRAKRYRVQGEQHECVKLYFGCTSPQPRWWQTQYSIILHDRQRRVSEPRPLPMRPPLISLSSHHRCYFFFRPLIVDGGAAASSTPQSS